MDTNYNEVDEIIYRKKLDWIKQILNSHEIMLKDYTYSPFLLDEYSISFISKFVLSPYYS